MLTARSTFGAGAVEPKKSTNAARKVVADPMVCARSGPREVDSRATADNRQLSATTRIHRAGHANQQLRMDRQLKRRWLRASERPDGT